MSENIRGHQCVVWHNNKKIKEIYLPRERKVPFSD